jgi:hypothetical protein
MAKTARRTTHRSSTGTKLYATLRTASRTCRPTSEPTGRTSRGGRKGRSSRRVRQRRIRQAHGRSVGSHGVIGHELPGEALRVTKLRVSVSTQVLQAVARVAVVPEVGLFRPGVNDAPVFRGGHGA